MNRLLLFLCLLGQTDAKPATPAKAPTPLDQFKQEAADYTIHLNDAGHSKLVLDPKPVLHWTNPARTAEDGAVFVWLNRGRPEVIGSTFTYKIQDVRRKHELHSLSTSALTADFRGKLAWKPRQPGLKFAPVPGAPVPAENSRMRLVQMKALTRDFSASIKTDDGETAELRLLPQPLYRYEPSGGEVLDGALFSFASGTDPEVLLLIEARREKDAWRWQYACARFNYAKLTASFKGEVVWSVEPDPAQALHDFGDTIHVEKIYTSYHIN